MKNQHTKANTFASRTSPNTDQSLQKSVLFSHPRRNSFYFAPALRCFNFFATAQQPTTEEYLDRTKQDTNRLQYDSDKKARTGKKRYITLGFKWLCKRSAPHQVRCNWTG